MTPSRLAAAMLAASLVVPPARAGEHTSYHYLGAPPGALQPCRAGMLLNLPASWEVGHGAVVLLTTERTHDPAHEVLVAALLFEERAAVLELMAVRCDAASDARAGIMDGAIDALAAMTHTMGSGMVVGIGYGPGARAMLDVVGAPAAGPLGESGRRYAAAVAIGDGPPAFALGAPLPAQEDAPPRLAALCRALAVAVGGMGATPERAAPAAAAEACTAALAAETAQAGPPIPAAARR